jgi:hypothetical protein
MANNAKTLKNSSKSIFSGQAIPDTYQDIQGIRNSTSYVANNDGAVLVGSTPAIPVPTTTTSTTTTTTTTP